MYYSISIGVKDERHGFIIKDTVFFIEGMFYSIKGWKKFLQKQLIENIRQEPRFKKLMKRDKYEWEHFEV